MVQHLYSIAQAQSSASPSLTQSIQRFTTLVCTRQGCPVQLPTTSEAPPLNSFSTYSAHSSAALQFRGSEFLTVSYKSDFPFPLIFSWKGEELRFYPTSTSSSLLCGSPSLSDGPPSSLPLATVVLGRGELSCGSRQVWLRGPALWWLRPFPLGTDRHLEQKLYDSSRHRGKEQITFFHSGSKSLIKDFLVSESPGVLGFCPFCDCFFSLLLDSMTSTIAFHNSLRHT